MQELYGGFAILEIPERLVETVIQLNEIEYVFDGELLSEIEYIACVMQHGCKDKLEIGTLNIALPVGA